MRRMKPANPLIVRCAMGVFMFGIIASGSSVGAQIRAESIPSISSAESSKLNGEFLRAIEKGDVKKINALAQAGAAVNRHDAIFDLEDVRTEGGYFKYRITDTNLAGASIPLRQAILYERPESVRALLALGAEVKTEFFESAGVGMTDSAGGIESAMLGQGQFTVGGPGGAIILEITNRNVISSLHPTPAKKTTYLNIAQERANSLRSAKRREKMQEVVDMLKQAMQQ